jgi:arsenite methyltransferase
MVGEQAKNNMSAKTEEMEQRLRTEFNAWARTGRGESMETGHRPTGEQAIAMMDIPEDAQVLDLGCGSGWATRLLSRLATRGHVYGVDISDEMLNVARDSSAGIENVGFKLATAENLPFADNLFTHVFSMESLYYYPDISAALTEIHRVLAPMGAFVTVIDLYQENAPSHQWIDQLNVPVHLLSIKEYRALFERARFVEMTDGRLYDPTPVPGDYSGGSFRTREDYFQYRKAGSLMLMGRAGK